MSTSRCTGRGQVITGGGFFSLSAMWNPVIELSCLVVSQCLNVLSHCIIPGFWVDFHIKVFNVPGNFPSSIISEKHKWCGFS